MQKKVHLPEFLRPYFWDVRFEELEIEKDKFFVTKRVLDRGKTSDVDWVIQTYSVEAIKDVVLKTRDLSRPTGNFGGTPLKTRRVKIDCLVCYRSFY